MKVGDTFRPVRFDTHLWVVISDPSHDPVIIVNLTTYTIDEEPHCILQVGDHPFIDRKTAVRYWQAQCVGQGHLEKLLATQQINPHKPASSDMLAKIWLGAALSTQIDPAVLDVLEGQGLLPD